MDRLTLLLAEYAHARQHDPAGAEHFRQLVTSLELDLGGGARYVDSTRHGFCCDSDALTAATLKTFKSRAPASSADSLRPASNAK